MAFLYFLSIVSPLFVILFGIRHRFTLLWLYAAAGLITEILSFIVTEKHLLGNAFLLIEFLLISFYFRKQIFKNNSLFSIITVCVSLYFILSTLNKPIDHLNLEDASVFCLIYILYGLMFFYSFLKKDLSENSQVLLAELGVNIALFVYASGTLMIFLFSPVALKTENKLFIQIWYTVFLSLNIFRYTLIAFALYKKPKYIAE
ncbi:MAG: hypothetical protein ABIQ40_03845 [Bacteroidia bacterium]